MKIIKSIRELQQQRKNLSDTIGFVATMGCLHNGHAALIKRSVADNDLTVLSIFVNPAQFNNPSDLNNYPITIDADLKLAQSLNVDIVFIPVAKAMYPNDYHFKLISNDPLTQCCEGTYRPGHFDGVLTVVLKLLNLIKPHNAYFGEKDIQQYRLVKRMAESFFLDTEIVMCPTVRETSGLALSSRNARLNTEQKQRAEHFARILQSDLSIDAMKQQLAKHHIAIDYIERHDNRLLAAVSIDDIRLIDNIPV